MKIKDLSFLKKDGYKTLKKLFIYIMIIITIFTSLGIFILKDFGLGYKYYEINSNQTVYVGSSMQENIFEETVNEYLETLTNNGYRIESFSFNTTFFNKQALIPKSKTNEEDIKKEITSSLNVSVLITKLNIKNDDTTYYFKTQTECDSFVAELNKYVKQEISSEGVIDSYTKITPKEVLEKKIEELKIKANQPKKPIISSRGSTTRSNVKAPMASYQCIYSPYGMRNGRMHNGVDFAAKYGTEIYAWKDGIVTYVGWYGGYGNFIKIDHNDGTVSRYGHCSSFAIKNGQTVTKGQTIGYVGSTGNSTGNHLHFEIQINGKFVNPLNYL